MGGRGVMNMVTVPNLQPDKEMLEVDTNPRF